MINDPRAILERLQATCEATSDDLAEIVPASVRGLLSDEDCRCVRELVVAMPALVEACGRVVADCDEATFNASKWDVMGIYATAIKRIIRDALAPLGDETNEKGQDE